MFRVALVSLLVSCSAAPPPGPDPIPLPEDACDKAEARLRELDCRRPDGGPAWETPGGRSFAVECRYAASDGRDWGAMCLWRVESCEGIDRCLRH